jgi:uncharacterized protein
VSDDLKDDFIVASAVAANAGYLVTGDCRHPLPLGTYQGIEIVSVSGFLSMLDGQTRGGWGKSPKKPGP